MHAQRVSALSEFLHRRADHDLTVQAGAPTSSSWQRPKKKASLTPNHYHYGNESTAAASWKMLLPSCCLIQTESVEYHQHVGGWEIITGGVGMDVGRETTLVMTKNAMTVHRSHLSDTSTSCRHPSPPCGQDSHQQQGAAAAA